MMATDGWTELTCQEREDLFRAHHGGELGYGDTSKGWAVMSSRTNMDLDNPIYLPELQHFTEWGTETDEGFRLLKEYKWHDGTPCSHWTRIAEEDEDDE